VTTWAFVSDIHGNYGALQRAASWCERHGVERYVCLGDVIGRGDPESCIAWVRDRAALAIVGNRDLDYLERVSTELQTVVRGWTNEERASDFILSHGDPKLHRRLNSGALRDDFRRAAAFMEEAGAHLWLFGHTHRARAWRLNGDGPEPLDVDRIDLEPDGRYVVNVGTTGMPLPGRGPASFVVYDDETRQLRVVPMAECVVGG